METPLDYLQYMGKILEIKYKAKGEPYNLTGRIKSANGAGIWFMVNEELPTFIAYDNIEKITTKRVKP